MVTWFELENMWKEPGATDSKAFCQNLYGGTATDMMLNGDESARSTNWPIKNS